MARRVFFSFHYAADNWRASQVRNIGAIEGNPSATDNDWEQVKKGGDSAIQRWIDNQLAGRSCTVVLIGSGTAGRKWINYEIKSSWDSGKGLLGVYIHRLKNRERAQSAQGTNPFDGFSVGKVSLSNIVYSHNPPYSQSEDVYAHIRDNMENWIEQAIQIRAKY
jgi:hypothetical protein